MVKLSDIQKEKPRVDLATLPPEQELLYISEAMREPAQGKTGGLIIEFQQRDGKHFKMKYSAMHGEVLYNALRDIGARDTADLAKGWGWYKLVNFRMGFPRYIPFKKGK